MNFSSPMMRNAPSSVIPAVTNAASDRDRALLSDWTSCGKYRFKLGSSSFSRSSWAIMLAKVWQVLVKKCLYVSRCAPPSEVKRPAGTPQASRIKSVVLSLQVDAAGRGVGAKPPLLEVPVRGCRLPLAPSLFHGLKGGYPALPVGHGVAQSIGLGCCGPVWTGHEHPSGYSGIVA